MARTFRGRDRGGVRVLEVGCGPGPNIWYLAREGYQAAGIDFSATALRLARDRLSSEGLLFEDRLDLREGSFTELPWGPESFDAIVDIAALYANRITDIRATIGEIRRCLKPDGIFFGKMFGIETTGSDSGEEIEPNTRSQPDKGPCAGNDLAHFFSHDELVDLFSGFGQLLLDSTIRTEREGAIRIFHWLVTAKK
jgi:ubiquinone/menaquinone biosynthesis C-methylase UbiE